MNKELLISNMKVAKLHLIYWAIIFGLLAVFLLCIAPGRVNERAFENFSFASIIVSIVLAVVSIVYSIQARTATQDNIIGIREIERNIDIKLDKFDTLEENISKDVQAAITEGVGKAILELRADVGNLMEDQADIKQNLSKFVSDQKKYSESETNPSGRMRTADDGTVFKSGMSFLGEVAMYLASLSYSKSQEFSFESIGVIMDSDTDYYWGFFSALSSCFPEYFDYKFKEPNLFKITKYNPENLGSVDTWENAVKKYEDKQFADQYLSVLHAFFGVKEVEQQ